MKLKVVLTFAWTFLVLISFVFFNNVKRFPRFEQGNFFHLSFESYRDWVWVVPSFVDTTSPEIREDFDGLMTYLFFLVIWCVVAVLIVPNKNLLGIKFEKRDFLTLFNMSFILGCIGMLMIWYSGPWIWRPQALYPPMTGIVVLYLYQVVVGPIFEEILFRGSLQGSLAQWIGRGGAAVFTSIFFAALHGIEGPNLNSFPIFLGAAALGFLRWKTDSLPVCILVHMLGNGFLISVTQFLMKP